MAKKITFREIADYFIAFSNDTGNLITNLKLQKLVYYAQAWHLAIFKRPLFDGIFEAWIHGPVLYDLYTMYRDFEWKPIIREELDASSIKRLESLFGETVTSFLHDVIEEYFGLTAYELERLVHNEDPWKIARRGLADDEPSRNPIINEWMIDFYSKYIVEDGPAQ